MPRNPLAEYIDRPTPYFDYTDAHTWYDGLWGGGQWPPEGIRGIGQFTPGFPPGFDPPVYFHTPVFFPGDRSRIMAGLRGLGQTSCDANGQNCVDLSNLPVSTPTSVAMSNVETAGASQTLQQQAAQNQAQQTGQTIVLLAGGALVLFLILMKSR